MKSKQEKPLLRIGAAAQLLGVSADTLRRWGDKGILKPDIFTFDGSCHRYYFRSEIEAFLKKTRIDPELTAISMSYLRRVEGRGGED
jgi:predicted site-specific integrase-resolvase